MNIKPQGEHLHKQRFLSGEKKARIARQDDERRERQGKRVVRLHESYIGDSLPDASELKAMCKEFHEEHSEIPDAIYWPYMTKSKHLIVYVPEVVTTGTGCAVLKIIKSEFLGLARVGD